MRLFTSLMRAIFRQVGTLALLAGCASGPLSATGTFLPPEHEQKLAQAKVCCASYREFPYVKLTAEHETSATLTPESPVFEFPTGRSFFVAFELPAAPSLIFIKTYPVNMLYNRTGHILVPGLLFLNAGFEIIETVKPRYSPRHPAIMGRSWGEAEVPVRSGARYMVLLDSKSSSGLEWSDLDQRSGFLYVRSGPTGMVSVLVRGG